MSGKVDALRNRLLEDISSGKLAVGSRIMSRQQLARHYGYSRSTVDRVLSVLVSEGRLEGRRGNGTYVLPPDSGGGIRRIYLSVYYQNETVGNRLGVRSMGEGSSSYTLQSILESDVPLHVGELTSPGAVMLWESPSPKSLYFMDVLKAAGTRQLLINRTYPGYDWISTDQYASIRDGLSWLMIEGGRDLALVSYRPSPDRPYLYERLEAFYENAAELGGHFEPGALHCRPFENLAIEIAEVGHALFAHSGCPRAIAVLHRDLALPLVTCGETYGKRLGADYKLFCFDFEPVFLHHSGVCMIRQKVDFMFKEALRWLDELTCPRERPWHKLIKGDLVVT